MSKKPKKGASKPSTVQPQSQAATQDLPGIGDALPSQDKTRAKSAKTKAATKAASSSATKAEPSKGQPAPKKSAAAKSNEAPKKAAAVKSTEATKKAAAAKPIEGSKKAGAAKKDAKRDKPRAVDGNKNSGSGANSDDAEKGRAKKGAGAKRAGSEKSAQRKPAPSNARLESGEDDGAQLTFANSPFADSPHSDSPHADAKTSKRKQKLQKVSDSQDQTSLKTPAGKRSKKQRAAAEPEARDVGATDNDIEPQAAVGAPDESDEPRTEQTDNAAPDETLIDAAALAPEGEPTGDEDEAFEPSLLCCRGPDGGRRC